jgi:hypothetical protein
MKCREAEDLLEAYGALAEACGLAVNALAKVLSGSRAEFWGALQIAESAKMIAMRPLKRLISISLDTSASRTDAMQSAQRTFQTLPSGAMASWSEFLRIEADLAMTFIDAARIHSNPANSARSLGNARKALAEIQRGLMKPTAVVSK